jgi:hypothetical protein
MNTNVIALSGAASAGHANTQEIGVWILCLAAVLGVVYYLKEIFVRKPSVESEFLTKAEFASYRVEQREDTRRLFEKMEELRESTQLAGERRSQAAQLGHAELSAMISRLDERTEAIAKRISKT